MFPTLSLVPLSAALMPSPISRLSVASSLRMALLEI